MKRAFLVLGAESSGTRLLTKLLTTGGCHGDDSHDQPFDRWAFDDTDPIVWRRSFPWMTYRLWPNIKLDLLKPLAERGYETRALVTVRDWGALRKSQVKNNHVRCEKVAAENISTAYSEIFSQLAELNMPSIIVTYESLILHKAQAVRPLLRELGLNGDAELPEIRDESVKYYDPPADQG